MQLDPRLELAVERGIISTTQAEQISAIEILQSRSESDRNLPENLYDHPDSNDNEGARFVTGFSDIFLALGLIVLFSGIFRTGLVETGFGVVFIAIISWGLSEIVATWQRRSLPSMVAAVVFVAATSTALFSLIQGIVPSQLLDEFSFAVQLLQPEFWLLPASFLVASLIYYARFRLPFSLFMAALGFAATVFILIVDPTRIAERVSLIIPSLIISGLALFTTAMWFDARDRNRQTRLSDNAFWLHLVASPLIVHSIMWQSAIWINGNKQVRLEALDDVAQPLSIVVLAIFLLLMLIALIIDRRAMLVSCLIYVTAALSYLTATGNSVVSATAFVPILIGVSILCIGIGWQYLRKLLFKVLPLARVHPYVPPVIA